MTHTPGRWGGRHALSFEAYHANPPEWDVPGLLAVHRARGGTYDLASRIPQIRRGAPSHFFRELWYAMADGVRAGDPACIELAVRFIEAHLIVSYAGFARQRLARALRHAALADDQRSRLSAHFLQLLEREERCHEFREYLGIWSDIASDPERRRALEIASAHAPDGFARMVIEILSREPARKTSPAPERHRLEEDPFRSRRRWVPRESLPLKNAADEAGAFVAAAMRRCADADFQYRRELVLSRLKPPPSSRFLISPERQAQVDADARARLDQRDAERAAARAGLEEAKRNLEAALHAFRMSTGEAQ